MTANTLASPRFPTLFKDLFKHHPEAVAAIACAILVLLGWQSLNTANTARLLNHD